MKDSIKRFYAKFKALPKYIRIATYLVFTYGVFLLLLGVVTPLVLEKQIPSQLSQLTGRTVTVSKVSINPFLLRVTVNDFKIAEQQQEDTFVGFKQLQFEPLFWKSVFTLTPTLDYATLSAPMVNVASETDPQGNLILSFQDILDNIEKNAASEQPETSATTEETDNSPIAFKANKLAITDGSVTYADNSKKVTFRYPKIDFSLDDIDSLSLLENKANNEEVKESDEKPVDFNKFVLTLAGENNHLINFDGRFQLYPLLVNSHLAIEHFSLPSVWPYAADYLNGQLSKGELAFSSQISLADENQNLIVRTKEGQLTFSDLFLATQKSRPEISLASLSIGQIGIDSAKQSVLIDAINMNKLNIQGELKKNGIDLAGLYKQPASKNTPTPTKPKTSTEAKPQANSETVSTKENQKDWLVVINQFNLSNSQISVIDNAIANKVNWQLNPINIQLADIQSDLAKPIQYEIDLGLFNTVKTEQKPLIGKIHGQGQIDNQQQQVDGNLKITGIDLSDLQPYLKPYVNIDLKKGLFSTEGKLHTAFDGEDLTFNGNIDIKSLHINDKLENKPFLTWSDMVVNKLAYNQSKSSLSINTITLDKLYSKVLIDKNKNTNINDILNASGDKKSLQKDTKTKTDTKQSKSKTTTKATKPSTTKNDLKITINKILFKDGSAYFSDQSLTPNFASGINSINGYIGKLTSDANTAAKVDLKGKIDKYAPLTIKGEINPLLETPYLDLALDIQGAELTSINPYSGTYAGYYIDKGQMSLTLNYWLKNNQLKGSNHVFIDQLQLGEPSNSELATSLPIKLAIALLQDRNGVIDLGVNVSGDINDPSFGIGSIVLTALKNIIVKAVTAPFALLANLIGSDDELNIVQFASGTAALSADEEDKLAKLASALTERPGLKLSLEGHVAKNSDAIALAETQLQTQLQTVSGLDALPEGLTASQLPLEGPLVDGLETVYEQQFGDIADSLRDTIESKMKEATPNKDIDDNEVTKRLHITMYNQLVNAQDVSEDALTQLAYTRATNVKTYLVNQKIDPQRIFLINSRLSQKEDKSEVSITLDN